MIMKPKPAKKKASNREYASIPIQGTIFEARVALHHLEQLDRFEWLWFSEDGEAHAAAYDLEAKAKSMPSLSQMIRLMHAGTAGNLVPIPWDEAMSDSEQPQSLSLVDSTTH